MSVGSALTIVGKLVDLITKVIPKPHAKPPKYPTIKIAPKKPIDPYQPKDRR